MCPAEEPGEVSAFIGLLWKSPAFGLPFKEMRGLYFMQETFAAHYSNQHIRMLFKVRRDTPLRKYQVRVQTHAINNMRADRFSDALSFILSVL